MTDLHRPPGRRAILPGMNTQRPIPLRPDVTAAAREWRRSFVDDATVRALARLRRTSVDEVRLELRAPVSPMKVGDFPGGSIAELMALADNTALAEIFDLAHKIDMTGKASFEVVLPSNVTEAVFVEEDAPIPSASGLFTGLAIEPPKKVALLAPITSELEYYSAPAASVVISQLLRIAVGNGLVNVMLGTAAATAAAPAGLLYNVPPLVAGASASEDIKALLAAISAAGISSRSAALIVASDLFAALQTQPWPLFKRKVIETPTLAPGTAIAIAADGFVVTGEGAPVVDTSKSATLHMSEIPAQISTPGTPATIAAPVVSMFQIDSFCLRCVARVNFVAAPGAVAWIQDATW
ncbi:hypothetical protein [Bradyrhizobium sp. F1.13.3]|uniref:hypothetical protein n=1 Tax=Bradyrhizobium sp. F1.13.3 TaxID=3156351 RepID=UPI003396E300